LGDSVVIDGIFLSQMSSIEEKHSDGSLFSVARPARLSFAKLTVPNKLYQTVKD
jgi:hypothetical protein